MECVFTPTLTPASESVVQELLAALVNATLFPQEVAVELVLELPPAPAPTLLASLLCAVVIRNTLFLLVHAVEHAELAFATVVAMFVVFAVLAFVVRSMSFPRDLAVDSALVLPLHLAQDVLALVLLALPTKSACSLTETAVEDVLTALLSVVCMLVALVFAALLVSVTQFNLDTAADLALVLPMLLVLE